MEQSVASKRSRKRPILRGDLEELAREIPRLPALDVPALRQRWAALFGDDPSPNLGRALLIRAIAYRLQEKALPGLKPSTQRILDRIADNRSKDAPQSIPKRRASAGTVLIRQWRGVNHRVTVLDNDVVYLSIGQGQLGGHGTGVANLRARDRAKSRGCGSSSARRPTGDRARARSVRRRSESVAVGLEVGSRMG